MDRNELSTSDGARVQAAGHPVDSPKEVAHRFALALSSATRAP